MCVCVCVWWWGGWLGPCGSGPLAAQEVVTTVGPLSRSSSRRPMGAPADSRVGGCSFGTPWPAAAGRRRSAAKLCVGSPMQGAQVACTAGGLSGLSLHRNGAGVRCAAAEL